MFTEYSLFWIIPITLFVAAVTYFAYFYKKKDEYKTWQRNTLASLRAVSLLMILFLLLSPVVKITKNVVEKPVVVVAQDDSASLVYVSDSTYHRNDYLQSIYKLVTDLSKDYEVKFLKFGTKIQEIETKKEKFKTAFEKTETWFVQSETDIGSSIDYVSQEYVGENLSALVIASDGIANRGSNPLNLCEKLSVPVYTIALGDTNKRKDLLISNVRYNKIAYLDDELPLEITCNAEKANGVKASVKLFQDRKLVFEKQIEVNSERFSLTFPTTVSCSKSGIIAFRAEISGLENESNKHNNVKEFFVEVLDSRQNIVMLSAAPHPDISAMKQSIELNKNYSLESYLFSDRTKLKNQQIDLLIAHQLPYDLVSYNYLCSLAEKGIPILYVLGGKTDYALFNKLSTGLIVNLYNNKSISNSQALFNRNFALFNLNQQTSEIMEDMPPLNAPLARFILSSNVQTLAYQYANGLKTEYPLICFVNDSQNKCGIICGENIWRWRLQNNLINKTSEEFDDIVQKMVRYLVSTADKSLFRIKHDNIFNQGSEITFEAELYNESYQLVNTPEVQIVVKDAAGKDYKYVFAKNANAYYLNMGSLPQGDYTYTATTSLSGKNYVAKGAFVVAETILESVELVANHSMLKTISQKTGGEKVYARQMDSIVELIKRNEYVKPVIHSEVSNNRLIENIWYWLVIVLCLSGEWFLRKYWGRI